MILVIDLDDTLYAEHNFVINGMRAVAQFGSEAFGLDAATSLSFMMHNLEAKGRGRVFNVSRSSVAGITGRSLVLPNWAKASLSRQHATVSGLDTITFIPCSKK